MSDKLRGYWTFKECYDYLYKTGQIPRDDFDIDFERESEIFKALMPQLNLKENSIIITSTSNGKKGFFWDMWNDSKRPNQPNVSEEA